eukprot:s189_g12.t1
MVVHTQQTVAGDNPGRGSGTTRSYSHDISGTAAQFHVRLGSQACGIPQRLLALGAVIDLEVSGGAAALADGLQALEAGDPLQLVPCGTVQDGASTAKIWGFLAHGAAGGTMKPMRLPWWRCSPQVTHHLAATTAARRPVIGRNLRFGRCVAMRAAWWLRSGTFSAKGESFLLRPALRTVRKVGLLRISRRDLLPAESAGERVVLRSQGGPSRIAVLRGVRATLDSIRRVRYSAQALTKHFQLWLERDGFHLIQRAGSFAPQILPPCCADGLQAILVFLPIVFTSRQRAQTTPVLCDRRIRDASDRARPTQECLLQKLGGQLALPAKCKRSRPDQSRPLVRQWRTSDGPWRSERPYQ